MNRKLKSLLLIGFIYIIAIILGVMIFLSLKFESIILSVFIANVGATCFIFIIGLIIKNSSLYDPYWSVIPPMITVLISIYFNVFWLLPVILLNLALLIWGIRLTYNWILSWTGFDYIDWRYVMIKERTPKIWLLSNFFGIHFFPTVIVFIQLIGAIYFIEHMKSINLITVLAFFVIVIATAIQYIADTQMRTFKSNEENRGKIIDTGLWKHSRHPNYFGEVMVWFGVYLFYFSTNLRIDHLTVTPILMLFMFIFISIPMMEKKILKTRPKYKQYQTSTSMLLILPVQREVIVQEFKN
jgi:steroid 5-alpha reductase family enzyme